MVVVAVKTNGAPVPGVTDTGAGTTRWTLSDARGGIWIGLGFGAGWGADWGAVVGRHAAPAHRIVTAAMTRASE